VYAVMDTRPRWGRRAGGGFGPRARAGTCPYVGYGQPEEELPTDVEEEVVPVKLSEPPDWMELEDRVITATAAAEAATQQAQVQAALAAQAQEYNQSIIVGFIAAGAFSVLMWGVAQAVRGA